MYQSILTQNDGEENSLQPVCYKLDLDLIRFRFLFCWHTQMCKAILANRSPELSWEYLPLLLSLCFHVWFPAFAKPLSPLVLLWTCDNPRWKIVCFAEMRVSPTTCSNAISYNSFNLSPSHANLQLPMLLITANTSP